MIAKQEPPVKEIQLAREIFHKKSPPCKRHEFELPHLPCASKRIRTDLFLIERLAVPAVRRIPARFGKELTFLLFTALFKHTLLIYILIISSSFHYIRQMTYRRRKVSDSTAIVTANYFCSVSHFEVKICVKKEGTKVTTVRCSVNDILRSLYATTLTEQE